MTSNPSNPSEPRKAFWERILKVGSIIGAIGAIIGLPGVVYAVWKNSNELLDSFTSPDVVASASRFSIRCAYRKSVTDETPLNMSDCEQQPLAVSVLLTFSNTDFIPRSMSDIAASLLLEGAAGHRQTYDLTWPRSVSHQVINGVSSVVWTSWPSIEIGARESFKQEIMFTRKDEQPAYKSFLDTMYGDGNSPYHTAGIRVAAKFVGEDDWIDLLECNSPIVAEYIQKRLDNPSLQNQLTLTCKAAS